MLYQLVVDYLFDDAVKSLLDDYDFYIMPCVNPDGYQYSHLEVCRARWNKSSNDGNNIDPVERMLWRQ